MIEAARVLSKIALDGPGRHPLRWFRWKLRPSQRAKLLEDLGIEGEAGWRSPD